ncbi:MAG: WS/DGAT domain-containing protein [Acidimicrobiales bacterium]
MTRLDRQNPAFNLVISNVPGPRRPLYMAGAGLMHYFPVSTILDGQGPNITVQSYLDTLDFGLVGCRELVPDLWDLLDDIMKDLDQLAKAAGV